MLRLRDAASEILIVHPKFTQFKQTTDLEQLWVKKKAKRRPLGRPLNS